MDIYSNWLESSWISDAVKQGTGSSLVLNGTEKS